METEIQKKGTTLLGKNKKRTLIFLAVLAVSGLTTLLIGWLSLGGGAQTTAAIGMSGSEKVVTSVDLVAMVGSENTTSESNKVGSSWPGEIISAEISQIQPQRQGVIVDWRVRVGDTVSKGDILGTISAPPATPELIKMLAEQTEAVARARAGVIVADSFAVKERNRLSALKDALGSTNELHSDFSFTALVRIREKIATKRATLRSFIERALSNQVAHISAVNDLRSFRDGSLYRKYGSLNQDVQNTFEPTLIRLIALLKKSDDVPIADAERYFALAVRLANSSGNDESVSAFKAIAAEDQREFLEVLADYQEAETELADKETEYAIMISERGAMVEKERQMAEVDATAAEAAYKTVSREINSGSSIIAPRTGTISAIYKKVGELVLPEMPIAVVAGYGDAGLTVRMRIPGNVRKPAKGDIFSVMRPGFPDDEHQARLIGIGTSLDETGSYMADAVLIDRVDWPAFASVRVITPADSIVPVIKLSSVWRDKVGLPHVWAVSSAGRLFARKITLGRVLGASVEVYDGIKKGDRYIVSPTSDMREDMFLDDVMKTSEKNDSTDSFPAKSGGHESMEGMEM